MENSIILKFFVLLSSKSHEAHSFTCKVQHVNICRQLQAPSKKTINLVETHSCITFQRKQRKSQSKYNINYEWQFIEQNNWLLWRIEVNYKHMNTFGNYMEMIVLQTCKAMIDLDNWCLYRRKNKESELSFHTTASKLMGLTIKKKTTEIVTVFFHENKCTVFELCDANLFLDKWNFYAVKVFSFLQSLIHLFCRQFSI